MDRLKPLSLNESSCSSKNVTAQTSVSIDSARRSDLDDAFAASSTRASAPGSSRKQSGYVNYEAQQMIGQGSFGAVFLVRVLDSDEQVAIKKVLQDPRFKNRELMVMRMLIKQPHPFIVSLKHYFTSKGSQPDEVYLNLVMEYLPETLHSMIRYYFKRKETLPQQHAVIYMYQLCRSLAHIHGMGICHRDIKPHNLLVDPVRHVLKLCDFGSAKAFVKGEPNVAYICSRFYRAPELIFGCTDYTTAIDVWSAGCVFAELLLGSPIFPGCSAPDQLVEIIKIMGTPSEEQLQAFNANYKDFKFPQIQAHPWTSIFKSSSVETIDLLGGLLEYVPLKRLQAIDACAHPFFDSLRNPKKPSDRGEDSVLCDKMLEFTEEELSLASADTIRVLRCQAPEVTAF